MTLNVVFVPHEIEEEDLSLSDDLSDILDFYYHLEESNRILQIAEEIMGLLDELSLGGNFDIEVVIEHDPQEVARSRMEELLRVTFNETTIGFRPANKLVVNSLSRKIYNKGSDIVSETNTCTICLEEYKNGGRIMTLPCGHEFDDECIVEWFKTSHICPLCRFELPCEDEGELGLGY